MPAKVGSDDLVRLVLLAPAPNGLLVAETVARMLDLPLAEAAAKLSEAPADLHGPMAPDKASRLALMLRLFGLRVRLELARAVMPHPVARFDLAVQCVRPDAMPGVAADLAPHLDGGARSVARALAQPEGLVMRGLDCGRLGAWRDRLRGVAALRLVVSDPESALYDLLPWGRPAQPRQAEALALHLRRLGLARCMMTGAKAGGLDRALRDHVLSRFPGGGMIAMNRDFQRFDLELVAAQGLSQGELEGFLTARGGLPRPRCGAAPPALPLRIECALSRADALAFQTDYAAIGLETRARLVWPQERRG